MKTRSPFEPLLFAGLILVGVGIGIYTQKWMRGTPIGEQTKLEQIIQLVKSQYVDSLAENDIEESAIRKFLASFDPHSVYIPPKLVESANQELKGGFEGIGVEFLMLNDTPYVVRVIPNGPAFKAGVLPGDRIITADSLSLLGMDNMKVIEHLKGNKNTEVVLKIYRNPTLEVKTISIKRGTIAQESVQSLMVDKNTAYFKILHFAQPTHKEFTEQFKNLEAQNDITQVIVDLRDNPGGYLQTAIDLLDEFVDGRLLLAYTKGKSDNKKSFYASAGGLCSKFKLICLVNEGSASASEIFSGSIQDLDRGVIIGHRTYGKGLVQETFQLTDGSQVRLTVSRYYIPSGRSIQKAYNSEGYTHEDSAHLADKKSFITKNGRVVKSEGGVVPDLEIVLENKWKGGEAAANQGPYVLDALYKSNLVNTSQNPNTWLASPQVQEIIQKNVTRALLVAPVEQRLMYQLWGPETIMAIELPKDAMIIKALATFPIQDKLLNP